jgi:hypothetical protein
MGTIATGAGIATNFYATFSWMICIACVITIITGSATVAFSTAI